MPGYTCYPGTLPPAGDPSPSQSAAPQLSAPSLTPLLAFVVPNYMFSQFGVSPQQQNYNSHNALQLSSTTQQLFQQAYITQNPFQAQTSYTPRENFLPPVSFSCHMTPEPRLPEAPPSPRAAHSLTLFGSHCSSPLQLDLLQLEERDSHGTAPPSGPRADCSSTQEKQQVRRRYNRPAHKSVMSE